MSIARSDITIGDMAASGHGIAVSLPQNVDRAIEDLTIDDMAASGHGSAVSLPQNVDRAIGYNPIRFT
jgi:hypothetical protein